LPTTDKDEKRSHDERERPAAVKEDKKRALRNPSKSGCPSKKEEWQRTRAR